MTPVVYYWRLIHNRRGFSVEDVGQIVANLYATVHDVEPVDTCRRPRILASGQVSNYRIRRGWENVAFFFSLSLSLSCSFIINLFLLDHNVPDDTSTGAFENERTG